MAHHRRGLRRLLQDDALLGRLDLGYENAGLSARRLAMLRYAEKLTLAPAAMKEADVTALRNAGHSELDILHIAQVVSYFAFVNRLADGLGVELEPFFVRE